MSGGRGDGFSQISVPSSKNDFISDRRQSRRPLSIAASRKTTRVVRFRRRWQRIKCTFLRPKKSEKHVESSFRVINNNSARLSTRINLTPSPPRSRQSPQQIQGLQLWTDDGFRKEPTGADNPRVMSGLEILPVRKRYTLHEGPEEPARPPPAHAADRKSQRFMHPTVNGVITHPSFPSTASSSRSFTRGDEARFSTTTDTDSQFSLSAMGGIMNPVRPMQMLRDSVMGRRSSHDTDELRAFYEKLDATERYRKSSIPNGEIRSSSATLPFDPAIRRPSTADSAERVQNNRSAALAALGGDSSESHLDAREELPSVAGQRRRHPHSLLPGQPIPLPERASRRPRAEPAIRDSLLGYQPYTAPFNPYDEEPVPVSDKAPQAQLKTAAKKAVARQEQADVESRADSPTFSDLNIAAHRSHYARVESAVFTSDSSSSSRPETPYGFADNETHRDHYARVESGVWEPPAIPARHPRRAGPSVSFEEPNVIPRALRPAPLSVRQKPAPKVEAVPEPVPEPEAAPAQVQVKRRPLPRSGRLATDKPLPLPPSPRNPKRFTNGQVPPARGNTPRPAGPGVLDNGFPVLGQHAPTFQPRPEYQRRRVDEVEAKYRRDQQKKVAQAPAKKIKSLRQILYDCGQLIVNGK